MQKSLETRVGGDGNHFQCLRGCWQVFADNLSCLSSALLKHTICSSPIAARLLAACLSFQPDQAPAH